jgi:transposase, IS5 family
VQGNLSKTSKKGAVTPKYISPNQLTLCGFETPFEQALTSENRWVQLSKLIPWDKIVRKYDKGFKSVEGRPPISGRVVIGAVIIKHLLHLSDRETVMQIQENMFLQYFLGYTSFTNEAPFSPSLFVLIRERLSLEVVNGINEMVALHHFEKTNDSFSSKHKKNDNNDNGITATEKPVVPIVTEDTLKESSTNNSTENTDSVEPIKNEGRLLMDATVAPQNITYPTDLKLLNAAREKSEALIDKLYKKLTLDIEKPRTYREIARKDFLNTARKKRKTYKEIYKANGTQIRYLKRNLSSINELLRLYETHQIKNPLKERDLEYIEVMVLILDQQNTMHTQKTHTIENRIVNLHQRYVRPIKRGKEGTKVEFGSKLQVSLVKGFAFLDKLSWDNFNEGTSLIDSVEKYKQRFGFYPEEVLADQIYCNAANRKKLKILNIKLLAKPLGRPRKEAQSNLVSPGERNPIEGKFGQAKVGYGLANISAKLKNTSESWIASIILVLNLVNLTRLNVLALYQLIYLSFFRLFGRNFGRLSC